MRRLAILAHADGRVVGDHGGLEASQQHLLQHMQRILWFWALLARADGRAVGDHVGQEASGQHLLQQMQRLVRLLALLARADGCVVGDKCLPFLQSLFGALLVCGCIGCCGCACRDCRKCRGYVVIVVVGVVVVVKVCLVFMLSCVLPLPLRQRLVQVLSWVRGERGWSVRCCAARSWTGVVCSSGMRRFVRRA